LLADDRIAYAAVDGGEREILGRISPEKRSRPAQGSEPAAKLLLEEGLR
jgi:hypothetical protein